MTPTEQNNLSVAEIRAALLFYESAGVDTPVDDFAHDRFAETEALLAQAARPAPVKSQNRPPEPAVLPARPVQTGDPASVGTEEDARALAASAPTLEALRDTLSRYDGLSIRKTAKNLVFGDGQAGAKLMFVGEAPGRDEDLQGVPFVGRSGQLLIRMISAIGLSREDVYITNVIPWRPPGNRTPTPAEANACRPFIERHIELVNPEILVFLGAASAQQLTGAKEGILRLRGKWLDYRSGGKTIKAMATLHPAYLLRSPGQKKLAWRDFLAIRAALADLQN